jgi:ABC transporter with metal-binding/Fe-S-binding domain ATP-binding protein
MRLGVLFSGGKDSTLALHIAAEKNDVLCLISVFSKNKESYMFHTPNICIVELQAEALGLPLISIETEGQKEEELFELEQVILQAKKQFDLDGIVTGALESVYQATRIQRICDKLNLSCLNPLWKNDQKQLLETLVERRFEVVISGIFAYPLDEKWLGKRLDKQTIEKLVELQERFGISPSGEGGEIETTVLDAPMFKRRIELLETTTDARGNSGVFTIKKAHLVQK